MSEIKGSLLTIVLAVAVFGIVFGLIMTAIKTSTNSVTDRLQDAAEMEPTSAVVVPELDSSLNYSF